MKFLPGNAQHIGARQEQQDAFAFSDPSDKNFLAHGGLLALISDGMGGLSNGQQASMSAVRAFLAEYERKQKVETIPAALLRGLQAAFDAVNAVNQGGGGQAGATLVAAAARDRELYWVSVGDSHLYLLRRGKLVQLNRDHSYRERLLDQVAHEQIRLDDAMTHPEREHLTSYLGMIGSPEIDGNLKPFVLEPDDCVILCTDGVYRSLTDQEFAAAFEGAGASRACEAVKSMVLARATPQQDNLTIAAFRCEASGAVSAGGRRMRSKVALFAACLMLGLNLGAAVLAAISYNKLKDGEKKEAPAPQDHGRADKKQSPFPDSAKKNEPAEEQPVGDDASEKQVEEQGAGQSDSTGSKPAGKDTAQVTPAPQSEEHSGKNGRGGNRNKKSNRSPEPPPAGRKGDTQQPLDRY